MCGYCVFHLVAHEKLVDADHMRQQVMYNDCAFHTLMKAYIAKN